MTTIILTIILILITIGLVSPLFIKSVRKGGYGKFMLEACWIPVVLIFISCVMVVIVFQWEIPSLLWKPKEVSFVKHLDEYLNLQPGKDTTKANAIGPMIVVDKTKGEIATSLCSQLPSRLRADSPERVMTVVWLEWKRKSSGIYTDGKIATTVNCEVTVIDKASESVMFSTTITGYPPPKSRSRWESSEGSTPTLKIVKYLKSLPYTSEVGSIN